MRNLKEINVIIKKKFKKDFIKFALCYPNIYRAGISNFAIQLIYFILNSYDDIICERFFLDYSKEPRSIESQTPLSEFDIIGFSIQYELDYFNIIKMLKNAKIPILAKDRNSKILIAGGPCILENPIPLEPIFDIFVLGDFEPICTNLLKIFRDFKNKRDKSIFYNNQFEGSYFPNIGKNINNKKVLQDNLDEAYHPIRQIIPLEDINDGNIGLGRTILIECCRGCRGACYFCLIGWQNLPYRERSFKKLRDIIENTIKFNKNIEKISLIGAGISYHKELKDITWYIANLGFRVSIPSLRADIFNDDLAEALRISGTKQITIAPETGSENLRYLINKKITDDKIIDTIQTALEHNIHKFKLYFMIDLPGENKEDIKAIPDFIKKILKIGVKNRDISVSINNFIPKPHTPFQWSKISDINKIRDKIRYLNKELTKSLKLKVSFSDPRWDRIQIMLSRGGKETQKLLTYSIREGTSLGDIRRILNDLNISFNNIIKEYDKDYQFPWDFIDIGINKNKLYKIWSKIRSKID